MTLTHLFHNQGKGSPVGGKAQTYIEKVLSIQSSDLIAYWPFNETSGTTADNAEGTAARDGTFARDVSTMGTGVGIGDGNTAPLFDGTNDYCDIFTSSLDTAFDANELTISMWARASGSGVWTDGSRRDFINIGDGSNNYYGIYKLSANNQLQFRAMRGGTPEDTIKTGVSTTAWFHLAITCSASGDAVKFYFDGEQEGIDHTGLGAWGAANLIENVTNIGSYSEAPIRVWDGYLAHPAIWTISLGQADITSLATV